MTGGGYDGTSKGVPHFEFGSPSHGRKPALGTEQLELVWSPVASLPSAEQWKAQLLQ